MFESDFTSEYFARRINGVTQIPADEYDTNYDDIESCDYFFDVEAERTVNSQFASYSNIGAFTNF